MNLARLDEALSILIRSKEGEKLQQELEPVKSSITYFLENLDESFSKSMPAVKDPVSASKFSYEGKVLKNEDLDNRRRVVEELFSSEGFNWDDVINDKEG